MRIPPVGCTCVTWLKGNAPNTRQEPPQQEKLHHCNSHFPFPSQFCSHQHHSTTGQRGFMHHRHPAFPSTSLHQESECHIPCPEKEDKAPMGAQEAEGQHTLKTTLNLVFILQFLPVLNRCPARFPSHVYPSFKHHLHPLSQTLPLSSSNGTKSLSKSLSTPNASHSPLGNYNSMGHP